jgi:hypothetical protein
MPNFYFTYGTSRTQPFCGGWTKVIAADQDSAIELYEKKHPRTENGLLNCAGVYPEYYFKATRMYKDGNFGFRCHEEIRQEGL